MPYTDWKWQGFYDAIEAYGSPFVLPIESFFFIQWFL